jgi:hypothetical protein
LFGGKPQFWKGLEEIAEILRPGVDGHPFVKITYEANVHWFAESNHGEAPCLQTRLGSNMRTNR